MLRHWRAKDWAARASRDSAAGRPINLWVLMLNSELEACLNDCFRRARETGHELLSVEHLLLAILPVPRIEEILRACHADVSKLMQDLIAHIDSTTLPRVDRETEVVPTFGFQRVLQRAVFHVQSAGKKEVGVSEVLIAVFREKQSDAVRLLKEQNVTHLDVVNYISLGVTRDPDREG
jgi:ATP-dependent Clp protease ATP-binding subunit ClpA